MKKKQSKLQPSNSILTIEIPHIVVKGRRFHLLTILFIVAVLFFLIRSSGKTIENYRLAKNGKVVKALVTHTKKVGGKGTTAVTFKYVVNGQEFLNTISNEPYQVADSVYLLYLESSPGISRTYRFIKENYSTDIRLPQ